MDKILEIIQKHIDDKSMIKMVFGDLRKKSTPYKKISVRPVMLQNELVYQLEYHFDKKVTHENLTAEQLLDISKDFISLDFKQLNIFTASGDIQILASNPATPKIIEKKPTKEQVCLEHNQVKKYIIPDGTPCDFLIRLGVMDAQGKVLRKHYGKFRQINRFLEIVRDSEDSLPAGHTLRIIDFGCGKAYLTFALYYYLKIQKNMDVNITGLDLKQDVIDFCNKVASDLNYVGLTFIMGDIADYREDRADMVVTLHACDTATDYALINAVKWHTHVILSVPCCQHELFSQIKNKLHEPMYRHGILKERFTEILTDGIRGLALERHGYEVAMIEFTSLEHTARNIMIKAVLEYDADCGSDTPVSARSKKASEEYQALKSEYNINPTIDRLF